MVPTEVQLDFESSDNQILLNPRWPEFEYIALKTMAERACCDRQLQGHFLIATSGSSADSVASIKIVALSKEAVLSSAAAVNAHLSSTSMDVWAQVLPLFHVGGLGVEARAFLSGARVVNVLSEKRKWDPEYFCYAVKKSACTLAALVPTQIFDLVTNHLQAPPSLRALIVGGGALDPDLYRSARQLGWPLLPSYGMTETCSQIATASLASLLSPEFPELQLLSHAKARTNSDGYLEVSATSLFTCYIQEGRYWDPKVNFWFTTEDKGEVLRNALIISGRSSEYIKIGGEGTNLARLRQVFERVLRDLGKPQGEFALVDSPSERLGAEIHLVSTAAKDETELIAGMYSERVLPFEKIRKIHYLKEIPRSELGKILWGQLRRLL